MQFLHRDNLVEAHICAGEALGKAKQYVAVIVLLYTLQRSRENGLIKLLNNSYYELIINESDFKLLMLTFFIESWFKNVNDSILRIIS